MKIVSLVLTALFVACCTSQAISQGMPNDVRRQLDKLVGKWKVENTIEDNVVASEGSAEWAPEKECIKWHFTGTDVVTGKQFSATGLIGWDSVKKVAIEKGFSSDGDSSTATFTFKSDDEWLSPVRAVEQTPAGDFKNAKSRRVFTWKSDDVMEVRSTKRTVGDEEQPDIVSIFRRVKPVDSD